ncbi:MAG: YdeI/OmpD-associated family protein [Luteimonas sp.]|nr:YdeI/OmpD-associated family protein [Luteimonas sp.]
MTPYPHEFDAQVVHHDVGTYRYTVVFLPPEIATALPLQQHPRLRASGEVGEVPFTGAWQPVRGRWYLMLSKELLRDADAAIGACVRVRFRVEHQAAVEVPDQLARALAADGMANLAWSQLSAGKKRGLAYRVLSAKTKSTVQRRLLEVMARLRGA